MRHLVLFAFLGCGGTDPASFPDGGTLEGGGGADSAAMMDVDNGTCSGSCIPPVPMGWSVTAYDPASRNALCPMAYNSASDTIEAPMAAPANCTCAGMVKSQPTCDVQSVSLNLSASPQCGNAQTTSLSGAPNCSNQQISFTSGGTTYASAKSTTNLTGGSCEAMKQTQLPSPTSMTGRRCATTGMATGMCGSAYQCVPKSEGSFKLCIQQIGDVPCPTSYPTKHVAGSGIDDTRSCGDCSKPNVTGTCSPASVDLYTGANCTSGSNNVVSNGNCTQVGGATVLYTSYKTSSTPQNVGCGNATSNPMGGVAVHEPRTICCP